LERGRLPDLARRQTAFWKAAHRFASRNSHRLYRDRGGVARAGDPFEELFYRKSDSITIEARMVEVIDRCYRNIVVRLMPEKLGWAMSQSIRKACRKWRWWRIASLCRVKPWGLAT
jgi:hypothetical protein